ncbi:hypothetical protein ACFWDI_37345 [Streptomyces sp. NPDC060064]|uniref:hypothetical protein n=1 Tax=Streptomyces sp. NPDC060064 TaxID=3347049 RepID=UPI0036855F6A
MEDANRAYLEAYRRNAALMAAMEQAAAVDRRFLQLRLQRSQAFIDRSAAAITRLQKAGLAGPALDPTVTARALSAMVSRMAYVTFAADQPVLRYIGGNPHPALDERAAHAPGVGTPRGPVASSLTPGQAVAQERRHARDRAGRRPPCTPRASVVRG